MFRRLRRIAATMLIPLSGAAAVIALPAQPAAAATITIDSCSNTGFDALALWNAILEANNQPGPDIIELAADCVYVIGAQYPGTEYALPPITDDLTIVGNRASIKTKDVGNGPMGLFNVPAGLTLVLQNLTLTNGVGLDTGSYIRNAGSVQLIQASLLGDSSMFGPAIVNLDGGELRITDSTLAGLLYNDIGSPSPRAGVIVNDGYVYVSNSELRNNNAAAVPLTPAVRNFGYMEFLDSAVRITSADANTVIWAQGVISSGDLVVRDSEFTGHGAEQGAAIESSGTLDVDRSWFADNSAHAISTSIGGYGGAIYNTGTADITNSSFFHNTAPVAGGAVYSTYWAGVHYSSFDMNAAPSGADLANDDSTGFLSVATSILRSCSGSLIDGGANLTSSATSGCPGTVASVGLSPVHVANLRRQVLRPFPPSPAIDGVPASGNCPATDGRGLPRPAGGLCDVGAFENQLPTSPTGLGITTGANPGNTGDLTFSWTASQDADSDPLSYRVYAKDTDDVSESLVATVSLGTDGTTPHTVHLTLDEGTYALRVEAYDGAHASATSATLSNIVVDKTAPSPATHSADRAPDYVAGDGTGWYRDHVTVTFSSTDPVLADGSVPSGLANVTPPQTLTTSGGHTLTGDAADRAGNSAASTHVTYYVDADAPTIGFTTCPATLLLHSTTTLSWTASDPHSGLATPSSGTVPVDTTTVGERILTTSATDNVGHTTTATCTLNVIYDFSGFYKPVANPPTVNKAVAGNAVTITFSLHGNQGLNIFAAGYPVSAPITCGTNPQLTSGEPTSAIPPGLIYAGSPTGRYSYAWKTSASWAGTCRQFVLRLNDGTYHRANFAFK